MPKTLMQHMTDAAVGGIGAVAPVAGMGTKLARGMFAEKPKKMRMRTRTLTKSAPAPTPAPAPAPKPTFSDEGRRVKNTIAGNLRAKREALDY